MRSIQSMSLFDTIYQQIGDSSVQQLQDKLSLGRVRTSPMVDKGIRLIAESLSSVAQTEHGRQKLYDSIRYIDDSFIDHPDELFAGKTVDEAFAAGNDALGELIGVDARNQLSESLASAVEINQQQADDAVGYLAPEVFGCLKREIDRGNVLDSPDGIGQLFFGNGALPSATSPTDSAETAPGKVSSLKVRDGVAGQSSSSSTSPAMSASSTTPSATTPSATTTTSATTTPSTTTTTSVRPATPPSVSTSVSSFESENTLAPVASASGPSETRAPVLGAAAASVIPPGVPRPPTGSGDELETSVASAAAMTHHEEDSDWSWLFRFALPFLLVGALVVGGLRNCDANFQSTAALPLAEDVTTPSESELEALASVGSLQIELANEKDSSQAATAENNEARILELEALVEESTTEKTAALAKLEETSVELEAVSGELEAVSGELEAVSGELEQSQSAGQDTSELTALLSSITGERDSATEQLGLVQSQLDESSTARDAALAELDELKQQLASAQLSDVTELKRELESVSAENNVNREAFKRLNVELEEAKATLLATDEQKIGLETQITEATQAMASANEQTDSIKAELESATADLETVRAELDASKADLVAAQAELEAANASTDQLGADYQVKLESSEAALASHQDEIDRLKTELENTVARSNTKLAASQAESQQLLSGAVQDREELVEEITALKGANAELEEQLDQYAVELAMASDNSGDLQTRLATAEEQLATTQSELETNLSLREGFDAQLLDLQQKLDTARQSSSSDINRLTSVSSELQSRLDLMVSANEEAQAGIAERDAQITELADRAGDLQASLDSAMADIELSQQDNASMQQTIEQLEARANTMSEEVEQSASVVESGKIKIAELEDELQQSGRQITQLTQERDELLNQKAELDERISAMSAERDEAIAASTQMNDQVVELYGKLEQANAQSEDSQSRVSALTASLTDVQSQLALSSSDADKHAKQTALLAAETVRYQSEIGSLKKERDQLTAQLISLDSELGAARNEADDAVSALAAARETAEESTRKATLFEKNVDGLNKEIDRLKGEQEEALGALNQTVQEMRVERDDAEAESAAALANAASFDDERSEMKAIISDLQDSFDSSQTEVVTLTNRIAGLETEVEALNQARDGAEAEAASLRDEVAEAELRVTQAASLADGYKLRLDQADERRQAEIESVNVVRDSISSSLSEVAVDDVQVTTRDNNTAVGITIGSGNLFRAGSSDLSPEGSEVLAKVGRIVASYEDWKIDVEGHTDNQPIGGTLLERYPSNWELSVARASSAVRFLQIESGIDPTLLSARGFGETKPLDIDDTPDARRKNRRVEVVLRKK